MPHLQRDWKHDHSPTGPRTIGKLIRFRPDELAIIAERACTCGAPVARYIREAALGVTPCAGRTQANAELIRHLARIGNNLNQLARVRMIQDRSVRKRASVLFWTKSSI
jgi:Bacterial mobilisation protein (MobC)